MVYELTEEDSNLWRFRRISILTICPICPDLRLPLVSVKWVVWRGFEPLKIPENRLIYHKAHLSRLAPSFGITQIKVLCKQLVERKGFEPLKIPENQSTYHRPHLSRLAPSFGIYQIVVREGFEPPKIPKNRLIYHKPHLSRLAPSFGISQINLLG